MVDYSSLHSLSLTARLWVWKWMERNKKLEKFFIFYVFFKRSLECLRWWFWVIAMMRGEILFEIFHKLFMRSHNKRISRISWTMNEVVNSSFLFFWSVWCLQWSFAQEFPCQRRKKDVVVEPIEWSGDVRRTWVASTLARHGEERIDCRRTTLQ